MSSWQGEDLSVSCVKHSVDRVWNGVEHWKMFVAKKCLIVNINTFKARLNNKIQYFKAAFNEYFSNQAFNSPLTAGLFVII